MLSSKQKRNQWLVWLRGAAEVVGLLISIEVAAQGAIDLAIKILGLLHY